MLTVLQTYRQRQLTAISRYEPFAKQREFHAAGAGFRERLLMAGNQLGKTTCAGFEVAMHLSGFYPDWWQGRRFEQPISAWAASVTGESTRDNPQRVLIGRLAKAAKENHPRTAALERHWLREVTRVPGGSGALDQVMVQHRSGGQSLLGFKSYAQGREKWQGPSLDLVWFDEEPPEDIYMEGLTRTNATGGMVMLTFTPLKGYSSVVQRFLGDAQTAGKAEHHTQEPEEQDGPPRDENDPV